MSRTTPFELLYDWHDIANTRAIASAGAISMRVPLTPLLLLLPLVSVVVWQSTQTLN